MLALGLGEGRAMARQASEATDNAKAKSQENAAKEKKESVMEAEDKEGAHHCPLEDDHVQTFLPDSAKL